MCYNTVNTVHEQEHVLSTFMCIKLAICVCALALDLVHIEKGPGNGNSVLRIHIPANMVQQWQQLQALTISQSLPSVPQTHPSGPSGVSIHHPWCSSIPTKNK